LANTSQLAACRVWGGDSCGKKKQLMKALHPTSYIIRLQTWLRSSIWTSENNLLSFISLMWVLGLSKLSEYAVLPNTLYYLLDYIAETETPRMFFCTQWSPRICIMNLILRCL